MIEISIDSDIDKAIKQTKAIHRNQIPFAISKALNSLAKSSTKSLERQVKKDIDRPTNFTVKAFGWKGSSKRNLVAKVFIKDRQDEYLKWQVRGGTRKPKKKAEAVPVTIKLNKFGNIPGRHAGKIKKLLDRADTFAATINRVAGIWQRLKNRAGLKLLIAFEQDVQYQKRFEFYDTVRRTVKRRARRTFNVELARAIRSAR